MYLGSCLCGAVRYEVTGELGDAFYCHCQRCRKSSGSVLASNVRIAPQQFRVLAGQDSLKSYFNPASGVTRKFCAECGSQILSERADPPVLALRLGTLDTPLEKSPVVAHIFVGSKAEWHEITDDLPQFAERPTK